MPPMLQVKVLQQSAAGPGGSHQVTVVLDGSLMAASGERIPRGATVQLHWCAAATRCCSIHACRRV